MVYSDKSDTISLGKKELKCKIINIYMYNVTQVHKKWCAEKVRRVFSFISINKIFFFLYKTNKS